LSFLPFSGTSVYGLLFWGVTASWILPEIVGWRLKRSTDASKTRDRGSLVLVALLWWFGIILDVLFSLFLPRAAISPRSASLTLVGMCIMAAGIAFRWYSVAVLGKYFTFDVAIHSGHVLIEAGPYRYIRHPSYSGALLTALGFGLALGNWAGLVAVVSGLGLAYAYRIPVEEAALAAALGEPYQQYVKRTCRLVPFLF
jgi:protein-S-isoprenylcysteine O-methyltransferase